MRPKTSCDRQLHTVKLIPVQGPENRERVMPEVHSESGRPVLSRLVWLGLVVLTGLVLFFTLGRRTPAVVVPAGTEEHP